jgi:hypothetical protein
MARARVGLWDSVPDAPAGGGFRTMWDAVAVRFPSARIQLVNLMREPARDDYELTGPGPYRVRAWVSGQEEDPDEERRNWRPTASSNDS